MELEMNSTFLFQLTSVPFGSEINFLLAESCPIKTISDSCLLSPLQDLHSTLVWKDSGGLKQKLSNKEGEGEQEIALTHL